MAVITISRQMGSLGFEVARAVAERLGYRLVCRELILEAALKSKTPEMALATIDELGLFGLQVSAAAEQDYFQAVEKVVCEIASAGNVVIIGRASQVILKDFPAVHVRIVEPIECRVERIAAEQMISLSASRAQVQASDRNRRKYLKRYYQADWGDPVLYDLVINTQHCPVELAADLICQFAAKKSFEKKKT